MKLSEGLGKELIDLLQAYDDSFDVHDYLLASLLKATLAAWRESDESDVLYDGLDIVIKNIRCNRRKK